MIKKTNVVNPAPMAASVIATSGDASRRKMMDANKLIIPEAIMAKEIFLLTTANIALAIITNDRKAITDILTISI
jgi:hypothetical protein